MPSIAIEVAQARLPELIDKLASGEGVVITRDAQPVAQLHKLPDPSRRPVPGRCRGMLNILADDDEHLKDWDEYMP